MGEVQPGGVKPADAAKLLSTGCPNCAGCDPNTVLAAVFIHFLHLILRLQPLQCACQNLENIKTLFKFQRIKTFVHIKLCRIN